MLRKCLKCGKEFNGEYNKTVCPECVKESRKTSLRPRTCQVCGTTFLGGPSARYCPVCRKEREKERAAQYRKNGAARQLGSLDKCLACGKEYIVNSGLQKYCKDCSDEMIRQNANKHSAEYNREKYTPELRKQRKRLSTAAIPCRLCGKMFVPRYMQRFCSDECRKERQKEQAAAFEREHRQERNAQKIQRYNARIAKMTDVEREEFRAKVRARSREYYKKKQKEKNAGI